MNKLFYIIFSIVLVTLFTACDPIQDHIGYGTVVTSADQLQATVTNIMDNNLKTNKVKVHCTSPVNCQWTDGINTFISNDTVMVLFNTGSQTITLNTLTVDGTKLTKDYVVQVDEMKFPVAPQYAYFCGGSSKNWTWSSTEKCFGNGGGNDKKPAWWTLTAADVATQAIGKGLPAEGLGGTMKFTINRGLFLDMTTADGKTTSGKFKFDMTNIKLVGWSIGKLSVMKTNILFGYDINAATYPAFAAYDIISLDANKMILSAQGADGTNWYWVFTAQ